jgi:GNAT superfamily N-acetyltransferase
MYMGLCLKWLEVALTGIEPAERGPAEEFLEAAGEDKYVEMIEDLHKKYPPKIRDDLVISGISKSMQFDILDEFQRDMEKRVGRSIPLNPSDATRDDIRHSKEVVAALARGETAIIERGKARGAEEIKTTPQVPLEPVSLPTEKPKPETEPEKVQKRIEELKKKQEARKEKETKAEIRKPEEKEEAETEPYEDLPELMRDEIKKRMEETKRQRAMGKGQAGETQVKYGTEIKKKIIESDETAEPAGHYSFRLKVGKEWTFNCKGREIIFTDESGEFESIYNNYEYYKKMLSKAKREGAKDLTIRHLEDQLKESKRQYLEYLSRMDMDMDMDRFGHVKEEGGKYPESPEGIDDDTAPQEDIKSWAIWAVVVDYVKKHGVKKWIDTEYAAHLEGTTAEELKLLRKIIEDTDDLTVSERIKIQEKIEQRLIPPMRDKQTSKMSYAELHFLINTEQDTDELKRLHSRVDMLGITDFDKELLKEEIVQRIQNILQAEESNKPGAGARFAEATVGYVSEPGSKSTSSRMHILEVSGTESRYSAKTQEWLKTPVSISIEQDQYAKYLIYMKGKGKEASASYHTKTYTNMYVLRYQGAFGYTIQFGFTDDKNNEIKVMLDPAPGNVINGIIFENQRKIAEFDVDNTSFMRAEQFARENNVIKEGHSEYELSDEEYTKAKKLSFDELINHNICPECMHRMVAGKCLLHGTRDQILRYSKYTIRVKEDSFAEGTVGGKHIVKKAYSKTLGSTEYYIDLTENARANIREEEFARAYIKEDTKNKTIEMVTIYVPKDYQRSGIGTELISEILKDADAKCMKVKVEPAGETDSPDYLKLRNYYAQFGFSIDKELSQEPDIMIMSRKPNCSIIDVSKIKEPAELFLGEQKRLDNFDERKAEQPAKRTEQIPLDLAREERLKQFPTVEAFRKAKTDYANFLSSDFHLKSHKDKAEQYKPGTIQYNKHMAVYNARLEEIVNLRKEAEAGKTLLELKLEEAERQSREYDAEIEAHQQKLAVLRNESYESLLAKAKSFNEIWGDESKSWKDRYKGKDEVKDIISVMKERNIDIIPILNEQLHELQRGKYKTKESPTQYELSDEEPNLQRIYDQELSIVETNLINVGYDLRPDGRGHMVLPNGKGVSPTNHRGIVNHWEVIVDAGYLPSSNIFKLQHSPDMIVAGAINKGWRRWSGEASYEIRDLSQSNAEFINKRLKRYYDNGGMLEANIDVWSEGKYHHFNKSIWDKSNHDILQVIKKITPRSYQPAKAMELKLIENEYMIRDPATIGDPDTWISSKGSAFQDNIRDSHHRQVYGTLRVYDLKTQQVIGYIDYSIFERKIYIDGIEVEQSHRRKGYATALVLKLKKLNPDMPIKWGMMTEEGCALKNAVEKDSAHTHTHNPEGVKVYYEGVLESGVEASYNIADIKGIKHAALSGTKSIWIVSKGREGLILASKYGKDWWEKAGQDDIERITVYEPRTGAGYNAECPKRFTESDAMRIGAVLNIDFSIIPLDQFIEGLNVELEHADVTGADELTTGKIALAHLQERCDYYQLLRKVEQSPVPGSCQTKCIDASSMERRPEDNLSASENCADWDFGTFESLMQGVEDDMYELQRMLDCVDESQKLTKAEKQTLTELIEKKRDGG